MDSGNKQRFSSLKVFSKLPGGGNKPPPVPPKDSFATYRSFQASASSTSLALAGAASTDNLHAQSHPGYGPPDSPATGASYAQQSLSVPNYSSSAAYAGVHYGQAPAGRAHSPPEESPRGRENGGFRKSIMKLTSLSRKPFIRQASATAAMSALREEVPQHDPEPGDGLPPPPKEDPNISRPWGFEHHVHVTEDFSGIPQSWAESLAAQGLSDAEILQMHQRRLQQQQQQQQQTSSNPSSPAGSLNGRPAFRQPERQGSLPITDDTQSQSLHGHGHGSGSGSHHYSPVLSHPGLPAANGYSNSRPASPARRIGTPQPAPIRTSPMHVQSDSTGSANIVSPPPSYSAGVGMNGFQPQPVPLDARQQGLRTSPPDRPIPQPPQLQAAPPVHEQQTSGESAVIDVTGLLGSDDEADQDSPSRRDGDEGSDEDDRSEEEPEPEEQDEDEDEEDDDGASGDAVGAMPSFKLPALPPRLSIHQDGGLGDFDFTDALFSSLAPDTLLSLSSDPQPQQTRTKPPVIVERPPSMLPESPGLFSAMSGGNSPGLPSAGLSSTASTPGAHQTINNNSLSPLMTNVSASTPPANSALSTAAFSLGDFPMPPPLAEPKVGSPLSPIARSRSPFASASGASTPSTRAGTPPVRSTPTPPVQIAVSPRSPMDGSDHSPSPVASEPPSPAPPIKDATIAVVSVAKRAVATEVRSPSSGRNSPANPSPPPRVGSPASGRNSPANALPPRVAALSNASSSSRPASPANAMPARVAALSNASSSGRPSTADSPSRQSPISVSSSPSRPSTAPTPAPQPVRALSPTMGHRPPPLKLGVDVSDERLQAKVQRSPDPRDFANGRSPAKSPTTAILSQLVSTHLPPSPTSTRPSAVSPQHGRAESASSVKRKPVPQIPLPQPPVQQQPAQQQQQHSRQKSTIDSPTALDEWLSGETDDAEEDEESPARGEKEDDNDMVSAESVLDSWLNSDGGDSTTTTPGESPQQYARSKPLPPPAHPPPNGPPPRPPAPRDPAPVATPRSDVPMLRVDTAASTSRPSDVTPMQQHQQLNSQASALSTALPVAPPAPWLQGSPASEKRPVYLPAELEPLRELIHLSTDAREMFGELVLVAQGQYGDVYAANQGGPPCALKIAPLYIAAPLTPASAASKASTPGVFDEFGHLRAVKVSPKMAMLKHELVYIGRMRHEHVLGMDALYFVEDSLWIRMELMVRSLADLVGLCGELGDSDEEFGLEEPEVARFAADTLEALKYLEGMGIAHRDVRSDNLLLNNQGVVKLADFSHAVKKTEGEAIVCRDIVGVAYWRAAEINSGPYDPMRVDVWSLGATVWELMESEPPFERTKQLATRWPALQRAQNPSAALQDFLRKCSDPPASRPPAAQLLQTPWIKSACRRARIVELLERARQIEESLSLDAEDEGEDS